MTIPASNPAPSPDRSARRRVVRDKAFRVALGIAAVLGIVFNTTLYTGLAEGDDARSLWPILYIGVLWGAIYGLIIGVVPAAIISVIVGLIGGSVDSVTPAAAATFPTTVATGRGSDRDQRIVVAGGVAKTSLTWWRQAIGYGLVMVGVELLRAIAIAGLSEPNRLLGYVPWLIAFGVGFHGRRAGFALGPATLFSLWVGAISTVSGFVQVALLMAPRQTFGNMAASITVGIVAIALIESGLIGGLGAWCGGLGQAVGRKPGSGEQ